LSPWPEVEPDIPIVGLYGKLIWLENRNIARQEGAGAIFVVIIIVTGWWKLNTDEPCERSHDFKVKTGMLIISAVEG
jgi:hypothetical protein